jgi:G3E family GTPase
VSRGRRSIPLTVVGGYLGAGKTTLVNEVLREPVGRAVAVVVNDFGDLAIDADLLLDARSDTITLSNGCVCCTLAGGFAAALTGLRERERPPDQVLVEASGVADPFAVGQYGHLPGFRLDAVLTLADAELVQEQADDPYVGQTVRHQLRRADLVVLTKLDLLSGSAGDAVRRWLTSEVPGATVVEADRGRLPPELLFGEEGPEGSDRVGPTPTSPTKDHRPEVDYETWAWDAEVTLERDTLQELAEGAGEGVLRAKGIVQLGDDPERRTVLQLVGRRWSLRPGEPWGGERPRSRVVVIARRGHLDGDRLRRLLESSG